MKLKPFIYLFNSLMLAGIFSLSSLQAQEKKENKPEFSLNAREAYDRWQSAPKNINILDVRTPGEYIFVGHAPMAHNIPIMFLESKWDVENERIHMPVNENFLAEVTRKFQQDDTLLVMCRSGSRSAKSVKILREAGFKNVYNIHDGFEGTTLKLADSYNFGQRIVNGWKNSGAPWTNKIEPNLIYIEND
ncbi:MAG: sulfurtransferase [Calditrichaeota bacterium]|nr:MAG: sulfurtransferase [Calditrichota bacterium]